MNAGIWHGVHRRDGQRSRTCHVTRCHVNHRQPKTNLLFFFPHSDTVRWSVQGGSKMHNTCNFSITMQEVYT